MSGNGESFEVTIAGEGQVHINGLRPNVEYTVTEQTAWSWRYDSDHDSQKKTITTDENNVNNIFTFTAQSVNQQWLDYEVDFENIFENIFANL